MALDDFEPADPERDKDFLAENAEDGEDLFDFPVVEMSLETPEDSTGDSGETEDLVLAAADLAGQLADELDIDFDFDDGLEDDLEALGLTEPIGLAEPTGQFEPSAEEDEAIGDDMVFDFDDLVAGVNINDDGDGADLDSAAADAEQTAEELETDAVFDFDDLVAGIGDEGETASAEDSELEGVPQEAEQAAVDDTIDGMDESILGEIDIDIDLDVDLDANIEDAFAEIDAEIEAKAELQPAAPPEEVTETPDEDLVAMDELAADILDEAAEETGEAAPTRLDFLSKVKIPALSSNKAAWVLVGVILFFNGLTALLGFYAISVFSDGLEGMSTNLADSLHQIQTAKVEVASIPQVPQSSPEEEVTNTSGTVFAGPMGTPTEAPEVTELKAARKQLDEGQFHEARRRLFRLLSVADSPLLGDGDYAEAEASLMIAESYFLEAEALKEKAK